MSKQEYTTLGKNIFEFRYDPIISFYDWKGALAEHLIQKLGFDGFRISNNRIYLINPDTQDLVLFVSMQNAGLSIENNSNMDIANEKITSFLDALKDFKQFKPKRIVRLGVRSTFLQHKRNVSLSQIKNSFEDNIIKLNKSPYEKFEGDMLIDVGLPLNFKSDEYNYNITQGPMEQHQALAQFFNNKIVYTESKGEPKSFVPKHGLFFDIDVFKLDLGDISIDQIKETAHKFSKTGKDKFEVISNELFTKITPLNNMWIELVKKIELQSVLVLFLTLLFGFLLLNNTEN